MVRNEIAIFSHTILVVYFLWCLCAMAEHLNPSGTKNPFVLYFISEKKKRVLWTKRQSTVNTLCLALYYTRVLLIMSKSTWWRRQWVSFICSKIYICVRTTDQIKSDGDIKCGGHTITSESRYLDKTLSLCKSSCFRHENCVVEKTICRNFGQIWLIFFIVQGRKIFGRFLGC